jgi:hypothetical protein
VAIAQRPSDRVKFLRETEADHEGRRSECVIASDSVSFAAEVTREFTRLRFLPCNVFAQVIGTEFRAHREKIQVTRHDSTCELSPVPVGRAHRPHTRAFCGHPWRMPQT